MAEGFLVGTLKGSEVAVALAVPPETRILISALLEPGRASKSTGSEVRFVTVPNCDQVAPPSAEYQTKVVNELAPLTVHETVSVPDWVVPAAGVIMAIFGATPPRVMLPNSAFCGPCKT